MFILFLQIVLIYYVLIVVCSLVLTEWYSTTILWTKFVLKAIFTFLEVKKMLY